MASYIRGNVNESLSLSTLAATTLIADPFDDVVTERALVSSMVASWSVINWTAGSAVGPLRVGIAHSDYTDAEIEEWIETTASWDVADKLASQEISRRLIRTVGILTAPANALLQSVLNDGKPIKIKLNWMLNTNQTLTIWAYNMGASAFSTTNPTVQVDGHVNLWQK